MQIALACAIPFTQRDIHIYSTYTCANGMHTIFSNTFIIHLGLPSTPHLLTTAPPRHLLATSLSRLLATSSGISNTRSSVRFFSNAFCLSLHMNPEMGACISNTYNNTHKRNCIFIFSPMRIETLLVDKMSNRRK